MVKSVKTIDLHYSWVPVVLPARMYIEDDTDYIRQQLYAQMIKLDEEV